MVKSHCMRALVHEYSGQFCKRKVRRASDGNHNRGAVSIWRNLRASARTNRRRRKNHALEPPHATCTEAQANKPHEVRRSVPRVVLKRELRHTPQ